MSITMEQAEQYKDKPAVVCCRTTKGTEIGPGELEDPAIFPDLEDSGLLSFGPEVMTIGQVLGAKLLEDVDGLTPLTGNVLKGANGKADSKPEIAPATDRQELQAKPASSPKGTNGHGAYISIKADKISGLDLTLPLGFFSAPGYVEVESSVKETPALEEVQAKELEDQVYGRLEKRYFSVQKVELGQESSFEKGVLTIRKDVVKDALKKFPLVKKLDIDIIPASDRHVHTETIMDVIPVACKVEGELGSGITNVLNNIVFVLTGIDENGTQIHEFGSSEGFIDETIEYGRPGCPDDQDIIVRVHAVLEKLTGMERRGPMAAHAACDHIIQEVRDAIRVLSSDEAAKVESLENIKRKGRPRVLLVKEIMGQGAMHDNIILPTEPAGVAGGRPNVDLGNVPLVLSPNEVRDGGIHALCCIGPASKEMTRHYFREPLLTQMAEDQELDLVGVVFVGSPQVNDEKDFVSKRLGAMAETMNIDGAIVSTEGFGNNHIDFASHIEQLGMRGISTVGVTYSADQGQLVVGNKYMDAIIELNKNLEGVESEKLGENILTEDDARRAILMLKTKISGEKIGAPSPKWDQQVAINNQKITNEIVKG